MAFGAVSDLASPVRPDVHHAVTRYECIASCVITNLDLSVLAWLELRGHLTCSAHSAFYTSETFPFIESFPKFRAEFVVFQRVFFFHDLSYEFLKP